MHGARNVGGGEYSIYYLIKNLRRDIFDPIVFYSHENDIIKRLREDGIQLIHISLNKKITSVYRDEIKKNPVSLLIYAWHLSAGIFKIVKAVKGFQVDIIHPHDNLSKIIGGIAARISGVRVVAHCRDSLRNNFIGYIIRLSYKYLTDRVIAVSEKTADGLKSKGNLINEKIQIIYNGVDLNVFDSDKSGSPIRKELKIADNCILLIIIGVLEKYKGHIYLFEAIEKLKSSGISNFKCFVVGAGREKDNLLRVVNNKNLSTDILFFGYRTDIPALFMAMDILVMPSIEQEAFPRVAIESMAMKVPVVCSDFGGLPEAVINGETGIIIPAKNVDALYNAIKYLIENPDERKKMGEAGRKRVKERFNIEQNVRKTEKIYLDVLEQIN